MAEQSLLEQLTALLRSPLPPPPQEVEPPIISGNYSFVSWTFANLRPETALYIYPDSWVFVHLTNSVSGLGVRVSLQILGREGRIKEHSRTFTPTADRITNHSEFFVGEGFVINANVEVTDGTARHGQVYVRTGISRPIGGGHIHWRTLISDYVTSGYEAGWPGGVTRSSTDGQGIIRTIAGTDPAAGSEIAESVPTGARWRLLSLFFRLDTSAAAVTRTPKVFVDNGTATPHIVLVPPLGFGPSDFVESTYGGLVGMEPITFERNVVYPLPAVLMFAGWRVRTSTTNLQAGDDFGAPRLMVEEWLEE